MAEWVDTQIKVTGIGNGQIDVQVGPETFTWSLDELENIALGSNASEVLKNNIAVAMRLTGVKFDDAADVKEAAELRTFKYPR